MRPCRANGFDRWVNGINVDDDSIGLCLDLHNADAGDADAQVFLIGFAPTTAKVLLICMRGASLFGGEAVEVVRRRLVFGAVFIEERGQADDIVFARVAILVAVVILQLAVAGPVFGFD